ncbi:MAG TPA: hypothetical protein VK675_00920 [Candidatus Paceibacterota bacterium]|nr:hypothetical protein [Candidatus Paceibacterota bacterium]
MPSPIPVSSLSLLIGDRKLGQITWIRVLESRRILIKPYLDLLTLPTLGSLHCLLGPDPNASIHSLYHRIDSDKPSLEGDFASHFDPATSDGNIDIQGIWGEFTFLDRTSESSRRGPHRFTCCNWGISRRSAAWVLITLSGMRDGSKEQIVEKVDSLKIESISLSEILVKVPVPPTEIWLSLGAEVHHFLAQRQKLLDQVQELVHKVETEEAVFFAIQTEEILHHT